MTGLSFTFPTSSSVETYTCTVFEDWASVYPVLTRVLAKTRPIPIMRTWTPRRTRDRSIARSFKKNEFRPGLREGGTAAEADWIARANNPLGGVNQSWCCYCPHSTVVE